MLIRSQDNKAIVNLENIDTLFVDGRTKFFKILAYNANTSSDIGSYSTENKAIKVLDMIEKKYLDYCCNYYAKSGVFQMPADEEVEEE